MFARGTRDDLDAVDRLVQATDRAAITATAQQAIATESVDERLDFSPGRLERACERALALRCHSYRAVRTLIETPEAPAAQAALDLPHPNLRGPEYFQ